MKVNNELLKMELSPNTKEFHVQLAYKHNFMASLFLKSGKFEKSEEHFQKALQEATKANLPYSNANVNLGNLFSQQKKYEQASFFYKEAIFSSPWNKCDSEDSKIKEIDEIYKELKFPNSVISELPEIFNARAAFVDAHTNLGFCLLNQKNSQEAYNYLVKALRLDQYNKDVLVNVGNALRQIGKRKEAMELAWKVIFDLQAKLENQSLLEVEQNLAKATQNNVKIQADQFSFKQVNFICVKWGTLYGPEYVNKLFAGVKKYFSTPFEFFCLTENPSGLTSEVKSVDLKTEFFTWWTKANIFQVFCQSADSLNIYIDLDVVIVGSLDFLAESKSSFALLRSDEIACESQNKGGYNSSLIVFQGTQHLKIYSLLQKLHRAVTQVIFRFDFWLEMMEPSVDFLQDMFPGKIKDYLAECVDSFSEETSIVVFPRKPKPHEFPSEWVKKYWVD